MAPDGMTMRRDRVRKEGSVAVRFTLCRHRSNSNCIARRVTS